MFNIGPFELIVILIIALLVVGPARLPEMGRSVGRSLRELRRAQDEVRRSLELDLEEDEDLEGDDDDLPPPRPVDGAGALPSPRTADGEEGGKGAPGAERPRGSAGE
jgi:sec-independent protein translocase protein TatA